MFKITEKFIQESTRTPVARPVPQPTIRYWERLIADDSPESAKFAVAGAFELGRNIIDITYPTTVPDINAIPLFEQERPGDINNASTFLRTVAIPNVLAHEMRHVRNSTYREYVHPKKTKRYYDFAILCGLDEVSAGTTEWLADSAMLDGRPNPEQAPNMDDLWEAVDFGLESALRKSYLETHSDWVDAQFQAYTLNQSVKSQIDLAKKMIAQHPVKYCRSTKIIADYFLTFGDTHVLYKAVKMPPEIEEEFERFRYIYENMVRQTLQRCINTLQNSINDLKRRK